ncbi:unnamed protein product [Nippostrongylus brasiliensis]|uniref:MADF domain-containing protein n=1 Tax=Nippostrongylus brasiliensis TaxID=27835 RepID=A0A0N4YH02_NIPBR|nr:unnamed protein product [Nippostrongylus brasiliensis]
MGRVKRDVLSTYFGAHGQSGNEYFCLDYGIINTRFMHVGLVGSVVCLRVYGMFDANDKSLTTLKDVAQSELKMSGTQMSAKTEVNSTLPLGFGESRSLIAFVHLHPDMWDERNPGYKDFARRTQSWHMVKNDMEDSL